MLSEQTARFTSKPAVCSFFRDGNVRKGEGDYLASGQRGEICSHVEDAHSDTEVVNQFRVRVAGIRADLLRTFESQDSKCTSK